MTTILELPRAESELLATGCVIPAHPLALTAERKLDEQRQRALTRYYVAAGAGGIAVGVHTTQFGIRSVGLLEPVLDLARETMDDALAGRPFVRIAGACGDTAQAAAEAELAASLGYHAVLLGPAGTSGLDEQELLQRAKVVGEVLPVVGFYLQEAVGGRFLSREFWRTLADLPCVVGAKIAPFDRYRTLDAVRGISESSRGSSVALYTGNDDNIVADLLTPIELAGPSGPVTRRIVGGLLGQWAVWTDAAVRMLSDVRRAWAGDDHALRSLTTMGPRLTDANAAIFDAVNRFAGCIPGVHEVLRRQGLLAGTWCLDPDEALSPGQAQAIDHVCRAYPELTDDQFVEEHLDEWLR
ncbi:dihydrodipicolinate synthase family protein [Tenggerimyces flavus]|uniref:Dihydrodipicolinate synthase family protein n=1 Tax=Tenggerimyces flavus TaxID=1708749 RepID=A0ABV7YCI2_9ACTN|nr:dihydrodipicolinate synthase family protein [Tenggerimyces flavus]MBM7787012.1 hypothetical protein [Tenggerimyces flavus]